MSTNISLFGARDNTDWSDRFQLTLLRTRASQVVLVAKNLPAKAGDVKHALEESMAAHSSILGWRIPLTEEAGRLWSTGAQRIRHN